MQLQLTKRALRTHHHPCADGTGQESFCLKALILPYHALSQKYQYGCYRLAEKWANFCSWVTCIYSVILSSHWLFSLGTLKWTVSSQRNITQRGVFLLLFLNGGNPSVQVWNIAITSEGRWFGSSLEYCISHCAFLSYFPPLQCHLPGEHEQSTGWSLHTAILKQMAHCPAEMNGALK